MIYLNHLSLLPKQLAQELKPLINKAVRLLKCGKKAVSITICKDPFIQKLNKQYRRKDKPTDVLSFPMEDNLVLGDIIISVDTARKNCRRFGTTLKEELIFLVVHGLCHLLGHDHHQAEEEAKMKKLEMGVLQKIFGKKYHA